MVAVSARTTPSITASSASSRADPRCSSSRRYIRSHPPKSMYSSSMLATCDHRRIAPRDLAHGARVGLVGVVARRHVDGVRRQARRGEQRHARAHAERAHLVAARGDDAALARACRRRSPACLRARDRAPARPTRRRCRDRDSRCVDAGRSRPCDRDDERILRAVRRRGGRRLPGRFGSTIEATGRAIHSVGLARDPGDPLVVAVVVKDREAAGLGCRRDQKIEGLRASVQPCFRHRDGDAKSPVHDRRRDCGPVARPFSPRRSRRRPWSATRRSPRDRPAGRSRDGRRERAPPTARRPWIGAPGPAPRYRPGIAAHSRSTVPRGARDASISARSKSSATAQTTNVAKRRFLIGEAAQSRFHGRLDRLRAGGAPRSRQQIVVDVHEPFRHASHCIYKSLVGIYQGSP